MQRNKALVLLSGNLLGTRIRIFSSFVISNWMNLCAFCKYWSRWRLRLFIYIDQKAGKLCHRPNTWKLSEKHLSHKYLLLVFRAANVCLTTDADTELVNTRDGTEVCSQCSLVVLISEVTVMSTSDTRCTRVSWAGWCTCKQRTDRVAKVKGKSVNRLHPNTKRNEPLR